MKCSPCALPMLFTLVLVACSLGCASTQSRYAKARQTNTIPAYEAFLQKHPTGALADSARSQVQTLRSQLLAFNVTNLGPSEAPQPFPSPLMSLSMEQDGFIPTARIVMRKPQQGSVYLIMSFRVKNPTSLRGVLERDDVILRTSDGSDYVGVFEVRQMRTDKGPAPAWCDLELLCGGLLLEKMSPAEDSRLLFEIPTDEVHNLQCYFIGKRTEIPQISQ